MYEWIVSSLTINCVLPVDERTVTLEVEERTKIRE